MRRRVLGLLLAATLCLVTAFALADGTFGKSLTWRLSSEGELIIGGNGAMPDYDLYGGDDAEIPEIPWNDACDSIQSITIEEGVTHIDMHAFLECRNISNIRLPKSLTSMTMAAYGSRLNRLIAYEVADGSGHYAAVDGVLFTADMTTLLAYPIAREQKAYTVPDGVTAIGSYAFGGAWRLDEIALPDSLVTIGEEAFAECVSLDQLQLPQNLTTIASGAFGACYGLTSIVIPASVLSVGAYAFAQCEELLEATVMNPALRFEGDGVFDEFVITLIGEAGSTTEAYADTYDLPFLATTFESTSGMSATPATDDSWQCAQCGAELTGGKFCVMCGAPRAQAVPDSPTPKPTVAPTPTPTVKPTRTPRPKQTAKPTPAPAITPNESYESLRLKSQGDDVRKLQLRLIELGYLKGKADGVYGYQTYGAVQVFQKNNGLRMDGIAGKRTLTALYEDPQVISADDAQ